MSIPLPPLPLSGANDTRAPTKRTPNAAKMVARDLEAAFLTQMLTLAGVGKMPSAFGGGSGEEHFASFLVSEYAQEMAKAGGIGLSEHIFNAMTSQKGSADA